MSVENGSLMVERLLQFSRKRVKAEFKPLSLAKVVNETTQLIRESFDKKIEIQIDVADSLFIMGDYSGLTQALMNLCNNARDAMQDGGFLRIETTQEKDKAVLIVSDTGLGMDAETKEKCFDPFYTTKAFGKGTGLGTSIAYGIIKSHEGEIHVDSVLVKGTTFKLTFPFDSSEKQDADNN